jgi:hypothetical protein
VSECDCDATPGCTSWNPDPGAPRWQRAADVFLALSGILKKASGGDATAHAAVVAKLDALIVTAGGTPPAGVTDFQQLCEILADLNSSNIDPKGADESVITKLGQAITDATDDPPGTCTIFLTTPPTAIPTNEQQCKAIYGTKYVSN